MPFSMKLPAKTNKPAKQYGLIIPKKDSKKVLSSGFNVFATEDNTESAEKDVRRRVGAEVARSYSQIQMEKVQAQALAQDASVFDYDAVYDEIKSGREKEAQSHASKREADKKTPKYIKTLLQQAKIREVEMERIRERRLLNERKADDAIFGDKEKLVSASYKRKLQEMQRWDEVDAQLNALEAQEDVTKHGEHAMAGFYANLNQNIAMGGSIANARSAYTARVEQESVDTSEKEQTGKSSEHVEKEESVLPDRREHKELDVKSVVEKPKDEGNLSKEDAIAAAKERFLARKAQRKEK